MRKFITEQIVFWTIYLAPFLPIWIAGDDNIFAYKSPLNSVYYDWYNVYFYLLGLAAMTLWCRSVSKIKNWLFDVDVQ